jgi:hypothetical protein
MKKYKCYNTSDTNQETVSVVEAENIHAAINYFAAQKKLPIENFLRIFSVVKWNQENI